MADSPSEPLGPLIYRSLVQSMPGALAATDIQGRQVFVNPAFCRLVGWSESELLGQLPPFRYWPPEEHAAIQERLQAKLTEAQPSPHELVLPLLHRDGGRFQVRWRAVPLMEENGAWRGWLATLEDLRQQSKFEAALREREHFIESVTQAVPEIIYVYDFRENRNVYANRHIAEVLGFSPEAIQAMGSDFLQKLLHPDDVARWVEIFARFENCKDGEIIETEYRLRTRRGDYRWFLARDTVFGRDEAGKVVRFIGASQDITERKKAEEARFEAERHLRDSERRYRLLADHATDMISRHSPTGIYRDVSPACDRMLGYAPNELVGRSSYELVHPADRDVLFRFHLQMMETRQPLRTTFRTRRRDGEHIWVEMHAQPILDPVSNDVVEILAVSRDITDRKSAEEALRQSEELFRALVEKSGDGIAMVDPEGHIRYLSPAASRILGYDQIEIGQIKAHDILFPDDLSAFVTHGREPLQRAGGSHTAAVRIHAKNGAIRHVEITLTNHLADASIGAYVVNFRDISDRITLEEQLRQAQKMEAIGQLAGGIAHDFNNILTAVIGNVAVLVESLPLDDPRRATLHAVDNAARRAADLTNRLLGYSRRTTLHLRPTDLSRVINDTVALLRPTFDPRIVFETQIEFNTWPVLADAAQISQVVTNLCLNSRDAMPRGGRLSVRTSNVTIDKDYVKTHIVEQPGDYVRLTVEDTGSGMTPEVRSRVFEPFFTTKPLGAGTGLGLAMVYGILKSHGGWATCESETGVGTRMELYLPRSSLPALSQTLIDRNEPPPTPASEKTILFVDDEPAIRTLGRQVLEKGGYRVLLAEDGLDAIETFTEIGGRVDLVVLDLTMPRLSGQDTFRELRLIDPKVRVLFSSGYSSEHLGEVGTGVTFINKPYRPNDLLQAVHEQLVGGNVKG